MVDEERKNFPCYLNRLDCLIIMQNACGSPHQGFVRVSLIFFFFIVVTNHNNFQLLNNLSINPGLKPSPSLQGYFCPLLHVPINIVFRKDVLTNQNPLQAFNGPKKNGPLFRPEGLKKTAYNLSCRIQDPISQSKWQLHSVTLFRKKTNAFEVVIIQRKSSVKYLTVSTVEIGEFTATK